MLLSVVLLALPALGMYISLYFTLVYFGVISPDIRFIPTVCRPDKPSCHSIIHHPHARFFGLPNFILGIGYYLLVIMYVVFQPSGFPETGLTFVSWLVVALGVFLIYSLFAVVRVPCRLCLISHGLNLFIALFLTFH